MLKRKLYDRLVRWKNESMGTTALLIEGARRVGKSTIAEEFAKNEYASYLLIDFSLATDEFKQTFLDTRNDLDSFFLYLTAEYGATLVERDSLIIFDEVQLFPKAREFIKHLVADGRYDYVETGSLISIKENVKDILLPSEEESIGMCPLDFEEFLWAMGEEALAKLIATSYESKKQLPEGLHRKAMRLWREYLLVGGMPQAVVAYGRERNLEAADRAKRAVLKIYRDDIEKYGGTAAKRIKAVFDAIPGQLSKHEKKLVYTQVREGSRSRDFMTAFSWLREAMTVNLCTLSEDPSLGLALTEDESTVKCYMADTGLLTSMAFRTIEEEMPDVYRQVLRGNAAVNEGMLVENYVAQQLVARGHELYFYAKASRDRTERMEIDFLVIRPFPDAAMKPRVSPVEVKSGRRYSLVSLNKFAVRFAGHVGEELVVHAGQLRADGRRLFLPLYMAHLL